MLAGLDAEYFKLNWPSTMMRRVTTCLSIFGLGLSLFLEARYGTDVSVTKAQLQGPMKSRVYVKELSSSGNAVSMYYPGEQEPDSDEE